MLQPRGHLHNKNKRLRNIGKINRNVERRGKGWKGEECVGVQQDYTSTGIDVDERRASAF